MMEFCRRKNIVKPQFRITKEQIYEIFDSLYPEIKKATDKVALETKRLEDGRYAIQLTAICDKKPNHELEETHLQDGDIFYATIK